MSGAELHRIEGLLEFAHALTGFRDRTNGISAAVARRIARAEEALAGRRRRLLKKIEELEDDLGSDDAEDDNDYTRARLEAAEEELVEVEMHFAHLSAAKNEHVRALAAWRRSQDLTMRAAAFVKTKSNQAVEYLREPLGVEGSAGTGGLSGTGRTSSREGLEGSTPLNAGSADELPRLPPGFIWSPIENVDPGVASLLDKTAKVPLETMRLGLTLLWDELLPLISADPARGRRACEEFDREQGRIDPFGFVHSKSLAEIWSAFFGPDHIRIDVGQDGTRAIISGQHRIRAAREIGWKYVPAEVVGNLGGAQNEPPI